MARRFVKINPPPRQEDNIPFSLGFPGEYWSSKINALVIPNGHERNIIVAVSDEGWIVLLRDSDVVCDDLLMTACIVQTELTLGSNHEEAQRGLLQGSEATIQTRDQKGETEVA